MLNQLYKSHSLSLAPAGASLLCSLFLFIIFILSFIITAAASPPTITLLIDTARPAQEILGFGASGCWWAQDAGSWPGEQRRELLRLLYDKKDGLGLDIYRHNLGADTHADSTMSMLLRRSESMLDTKTGRYDWSRDARARLVMREAVEAGASEIILFANSAPVNMTKNGRGYGTKVDGKNTSNLAPERYREFAEYLGEITEHFLRVEKLPVTALSPLNEPEWDWSKPSQEGSFYTPGEAAAIIKATIKEMKRRGLPVRVEGPEGGSWESAIPYFEAINNDPELRAGMKDFAIHSYWTKPGQKQKLRAWLDKNRPDARLHMSEWCDMKRGVSPGMDGALPLARTVIEDFTLGRVSTWQWWLAASPYDYRDGLVHYNKKTRELVLAKRYWVLGQFSRYIPKGSLVLTMQSSAKDAPAMAARLPDGRIAVVCVNLLEKERPLKIKFSRNEKWRQQLRAVTDESNNNTITVPSATLPPHSVVTLIFNK